MKIFRTRRPGRTLLLAALPTVLAASLAGLTPTAHAATTSRVPAAESQHRLPARVRLHLPRHQLRRAALRQ